jgi:hypothetical protein
VTPPLVTLNIEIRIRQKRFLEAPEDAQLFDGAKFTGRDFEDCAKIMSRFHRLAEEIQREESEKPVDKVKP